MKVRAIRTHYHNDQYRVQGEEFELVGELHEHIKPVKDSEQKQPEKPTSRQQKQPESKQSGKSSKSADKAEGPSAA
jgi:hypothetical protein